ncbi:MAG: hypothetical protein JRH11_19435 [Deltaproteobacteria bacterium]|nr:hypothetical protein [Deltaproteobacteria bacterium]
MADPLPGVQSLASLTVGEAKGLGEEAVALAQLAARGVPLAEGLIVSLRGDAPHRRLGEAVAQIRERGVRLVLTPLFPTRALAARFERSPGFRAEVALADDPAEKMADFLDAVTTTEVRAALGGALSRLSVRVVVVEEGAVGRAASADPVAGDPDEIRVWETAANPWRVDRRTNRVIAEGEGRLDGFAASTVADLADRAQLALGRPAEVSFCRSRGRYTVSGVGPLAIRPSFTAAPFRIVVLVAPDEGTVAPLAIDTLDKALREEDPANDEASVRRIYARPYRRLVAPTRVIERRGAGDPVSVARASLRAARVAGDVATPLAACRRFEQGLASRLESLDSVEFAALDDEAFLEHLRERQRLVIEATRLLDRGRTATIAVLTALEATIGSIPRECYPALASPRPTRGRRKLHDRLARFAKKLDGKVPDSPRGLTRTHQKKWAELSVEFAEIRPLGIDVTPLPHGGHDARLAAALRQGLAEADERAERNRRNAVRRLLATARGKSFGRAREGIVRSLGVMLSRVASAKGRVAEGLSAAMLRLRAGAIEAGRRLEERDLVDEPGDALYLHLAEIEQGLMGEPGAYAARVRLRREDDERWRCYEAPRRIDGRRKRDL